MMDQNLQDASTPSAGKLLQQARKQRQMSLDELAAETRIPKAVLEALEADRDPANQAAVFVRGFYGRCARALGLPEQEVLRAYEARVGAPTPVKTVPSEWVSVARKTKSPVPGGPWAMVALLAFVVCIILVVALSRDKKDAPPVSADAAPAPLIQPRKGPEPTAPPQVGQAAPGSAETGAVTAPDESNAAAEEVFTSPLQPTLPGPVAAEPAAAEPTAVEQAAEVAVVAAVPRQLVIEYSQPCWTSVTDSEGEKLLQGIFNAGDRKEIVGDPPYRVVLGFAPGAKIFYEGQPFDMSSQLETGKLTGRITVPLED